MSSSGSDRDLRIEKALTHCRSLINYYESRRIKSRRNYQILQIAAIILSGLTPVLILWTDVPKPIQALPAALASIAAGMVGVFHFQENWVASKNAAESLKSELLAFETRTTEWYRASAGEDQALDNFVVRIEHLHKGEVSGWAARLLQGTTGSTHSG